MMLQTSISKTFNNFRVGAAVPFVSIADIDSNRTRISALVSEAVEQRISLLLFPKLCITGATCDDLLSQKLVLDMAQRALEALCSHSVDLPLTFVVGAPAVVRGKVESCSVVISRGRILCMVPEGEGEVFSADGVRVALGGAAVADVRVVLHPAADYADMGMSERLRSCLLEESGRRRCACVYCGAGPGESTGEGVMPGIALICENGRVLAENQPFAPEDSLIAADLCLEAGDSCAEQADTCHEALIQHPDPLPFIPKGPSREQQLSTALTIQAVALSSRLRSIGCKKVVVGVSGGLDSTLALLCCVRAFELSGLERSGIIGVTMPGFGTSRRTKSNAVCLMEELGITSREIPIGQACKMHLAAIGHDTVTQDVTYENAQARERTQILMDLSNMVGGIVVGTGDLSEIALGWCTYNGDHMSNYSVNASIPKTLIRALVTYEAQTTYADSRAGEILRDIVATPVSPELKGSGDEIEQITEDAVGPYELHDFFIYHMAVEGSTPEELVSQAVEAFDGKYGEDVVRKWLRLFIRRFFSQQFKRSCAPDGPRVTVVSFSPRSGWKMPSDASAAMWLKNI